MLQPVKMKSVFSGEGETIFAPNFPERVEFSLPLSASNVSVMIFLSYWIFTTVEPSGAIFACANSFAVNPAVSSAFAAVFSPVVPVIGSVFASV